MQAKKLDEVDRSDMDFNLKKGKILKSSPFLLKKIKLI
jgi:hypothetical protein